MTSQQQKPKIEDAYWFMNDVVTPEHKQRIARWSAIYVLVAVVGMPLLITFGIPFAVSLLR